MPTTTKLHGSFVHTRFRQNFSNLLICMAEHQKTVRILLEQLNLVHYYFSCIDWGENVKLHTQKRKFKATDFSLNHKDALLKDKICSNFCEIHDLNSINIRVPLHYFLWGGSSYCTKDLHLTRSLGGIPNFFFLLSVWRLKKYPQVGFSSV